MTADLDDLLRATMQGRAATVTSGPQWSGAPARRPRTPWIAGAAAAVAVLGLAGGIAYLTPTDDHTTAGGGIPVRTTCAADVPAAWRTAIGKGVVTFHGSPVTPEAVTPSGTVIGEVGIGSGRTTVVAVPPSGTARTLLTMPGDRIVAVTADDRYAVVSSAPARPRNNPDSPIDRITVVDLHDRSRTEVLAGQPATYARTVLTKFGAVLQDGRVYWIAGASRRAAGGTVVEYDIATKRYSVAGHAETTEIDRDVRGVGWVGGSVPSSDVPSGLPAFFSAAGQYQPVFSDGSTTAWQQRGSGMIYVRDRSGRTTAWRVRPDHGDLTPDVSAVSGGYVFFVNGNSVNTNYVLDTRSGALMYLTYGAKRTVDVDYPSFLLPHGVTLLVDGDTRSSQIVPGDLPAPRC